jgi:hypothetical protein
MTDDSSDRCGKVGYKLPPIHSRFQKGRSGNPRGRLKGVRNFAADVKRSLEIPVTLDDKGRGKRVSTQEALVLRLREKALKGDNRALETLLGLARTHNNDEAGHRLDGQQTAPEDQAILDAYAEEGRSSAGAQLTLTPGSTGDVDGGGNG